MVVRHPIIILLCLLLSLFLMSSMFSCGETADTATSSNTVSVDEVTLPDIRYFDTNPSDQFLVNITAVIDGHMYIGKHADNPHTGAHVYFSTQDSTWPLNGIDSPSNYPPIYAIADGKITRIDTYFNVLDNYRYGIDLTFAKDGDHDISFHYSIEPFVNPGDSSFYEPYILVDVGDTVKKGDIIAYMYLSPESDTSAHIHFNLLSSNNGPSTFLAPIIFTDAVVNEFSEKISTENGGMKNYDGNQFSGTWMGNCFGYKLASTENPFSDTSQECIQ
ncbi:hypothetical protein DID74_01410 [Candidatus Marinamargulisbacteria bacterium SCGC AG-333-B06]|nr:hypothetical protein DID74_01410 [Candidatus Marinamargulisbacteria bacterium SCGC AG-333-B06]